MGTSKNTNVNSYKVQFWDFILKKTLYLGSFDTEEDARRLFLDKWNVVKDPKSNWTVDMNNTKPGLDEAAGGIYKLISDLATEAGSYDAIHGKDRSTLGSFNNRLINNLYTAIEAIRKIPGSEDKVKILDMIRNKAKQIELSHDQEALNSFVGRVRDYLFDVGNWIKMHESVNEAEYQGREVQLGKPTRGDVKKFKVYVKDPKTGNVKKVNFGDPNMRIKKSNPARRKSFRARHRCDTPGPRTGARYWSCRAW
jgi:hypothetical protein